MKAIIKSILLQLNAIVFSHLFISVPTAESKYSLIINLGSSYSSLTLERFETYLMNISTEHFIIDKWNSEAMEAIIWVC